MYARRLISSANRFAGYLLVAVLSMLMVNVAQAASLPDFTQLARDNSPMVVNISTTGRGGHGDKEMLRRFEIPDLPEDHPFNEFFKRFAPRTQPREEGERPAESLGSGLIISSDGYILTNHHVIRDADEILVRLNDRRQLNAELIGRDRRSDIVLL